MDAVQIMRALAHNNAWANHRLLGACAGLTQAAFEAPRRSFFPSIKLTLNHILTVDWFYVDALEGGTLGPRAWADETPCHSVAELIGAQAAVDRRLIGLCDTTDADGLERSVRLVRADRVQVEAAGRVLLHLFQHQIHHRGQAHAMLAGSEVAPPQLDEFFPAEEAPLRAADFRALEFSEERLWGPREDR